MSEYRFARQGKECAVCGRAFETEEPFISAIFEVDAEEEGSFERLDTCPGCFEAVERRPYSRWTTQLPPEKEKGPLLDLAMARDFLLRLAAEGNPERGSLMHLLGLLLLRKRKVKLLDQRVEEAGPVMEFLVRTEEGEETIVVPVCEPTEEEAEELQAELGRLFGFD